MFCRKCGKEIADESVVCVHCGCSTQHKQDYFNSLEDTSSTAVKVLSALFPIGGLLIWLICKEKNKPLLAESAKKGALIGVAIGAALIILYIIIVKSMLSSYGF